MQLYQPTITGSLAVSGSVTINGPMTVVSGSLSGTASFASTASFVTLAQTASFVTTAQTASFVTLAQTASFVTTAQTASFVANAQSASNAVTAQTASFANTFTVASTLTAQTLVVQTITSSVDFVTGSTRFGSLLTNTHVFSGSVTMNPNGLFVSSSGVIGIGTTNPNALLTISGNSGTSYAAAPNIHLYDSASNTGSRNWAIGTSIGNASYGDLTFMVSATQGGIPSAGSNTITIKPSGFVGIGTIDPGQTLEIRSADGQGIRFKNSGSSDKRWDLVGSGNDFRVNETGVGAVMSFKAGGNIGMGTTNPSYQLDLGGGTSVNERLRLQRGSDDANQYATYGWNRINVYRANVSTGSAQTDFGIYQVGLEGAKSVFYISSGGNIGIGTISPVVPLHVVGSGGVVRIGDTSNNVRIGNDGGGTYMEQYGANTGTSVFRIQSSKSANATDYTILTIDPYSGLNLTKSGTGGNNIFASGVPIQVVYGAVTVSSGAQGTGVSLGSACNGDTPSSTQGIEIASVSFTPKKSNSLILIQTNSVAMWERTNISDHFYLWAANATDATILVKAGQYLQNFGSGGQNGGIVCLNGVAASWGTSAKTISFRIGSTGGGSNYEYNPYYNAGGFSAATVGNFTYTITEIGQ